MTSAEAATVPHPPTVQSSISKSDEMVAAIFSTTGTPPESPRRSKGRQSFSITSQFMVQPSPKKSPMKTPKNRRASYHPEAQNATQTQTITKSPMAANRRASYHAESPTANPNNTNNNSPVPLGNRLQPATAAAPVVGRHVKKDSLVGFDPLLSAEIFTTTSTPPRINTTNHESLSALMHDASYQHHQQQPPMTPTTSKETVIPPSLSNLTVSPPRSPPKNEQGMTQELRRLAKDLSAASPHRPSTAKSEGNKVSKPKFGRHASLTTPKFNLTPPFRSSEKAATNNSGNNTNLTKEPLSAPHRKLPWQRHRRSQSLETPNVVLQSVRTDSFENDATKANSGGLSITASPITPMMQDLYDVVKAQQSNQDPASLALPNLYKPAPTSFLTGTEIVRSSEQDPSPFQMEIPTLDQTLVAARSVQFVDVYRKEDMNFDLQSLVGLPRMAMRSFVETEGSPPPNSSITQAHRPVVESLLEAADDITVAGFFATENAGSADSRREAVILERQMQFVVVFRGTSQEQAGKTAFFKKKDKHQNALETLSNDNADSKVYASVKQAYMQLEHRVFDCLDKFLDQNPFCDVVFTGSSLGGGMATLGAFRYATNRPMVRVCCQTFGCPKLGNKVLRQQANSLPNLKVMRIEYGNDPKCFAPHDSQGAHVGHSILLSKNNGETSNNKTLSAVACRFDNHETRKSVASKSAALLATFKKERDITSYVSHLEQLHQSKINKWVKDFAGEDGTGVRGKDNEKRTVV